MKRIIVFLFAVMFTCVSFAVENVNFMNIDGVYSTSAYPGTYTLLSDNGFPKQACTVGVRLKSLPDGYHYEWKILKGDGQLQVQPGTDFAYIGQNGNIDQFDFSISIIDEITGHPVISRDVTFVFIKGFIKPVVPPLS